MAEWNLKKGESLSKLKATLYDRENEPLNLTNASEVRLRAHKSHAESNAVDAACTIESPRADGKVSGPDVILSELGTYKVVFQVSYSGNDPDYLPSLDYFHIKVQDSFDTP